jgi:hypothetical protein
MLTRYVRLLQVVCVLALVGGALPLIGCGPSDVAKFVANINPCGTILVCDPVEYRFFTSGYEGPGADPDIDPACTFPPFCEDDPFVATIAQGG